MPQVVPPEILDARPLDRIAPALCVELADRVASPGEHPFRVNTRSGCLPNWRCNTSTANWLRDTWMSSSFFDCSAGLLAQLLAETQRLRMLLLGVKDNVDDR